MSSIKVGLSKILPGGAEAGHQENYHPLRWRRLMWFELKGDSRLWRCASENCGGQPTWRLEAYGIGSNYCSGCKDRIRRESAESWAKSQYYNDETYW